MPSAAASCTCPGAFSRSRTSQPSPWVRLCLPAVVCLHVLACGTGTWHLAQPSTPAGTTETFHTACLHLRLRLPACACLPAVGVFPFKTVLTAGKLTMGYVEVETGEGCPLFPPGTRVRGQVFHYSQIVQASKQGFGRPASAACVCVACLWHVQPSSPAPSQPRLLCLPACGRAQESVVGGLGQALGGKPAASSDQPWHTCYKVQPQIPGAAEVSEGYCQQNVLASYVHLHFGNCPGGCAGGWELALLRVESCSCQPG